MSESLVPGNKATEGVHLQFILFYYSCLCINYSDAEDEALYQVHFYSIATLTTATWAPTTMCMFSFSVLGRVFWTQMCVDHTWFIRLQEMAIFLHFLPTRGRRVFRRIGLQNDKISKCTLNEQGSPWTENCFTGYSCLDVSMNHLDKVRMLHCFHHNIFIEKNGE